MVPIFLSFPSSLKVIAVSVWIVSAFTVSAEAAVAADAKMTDDRFKFEAGRTARVESLKTSFIEKSGSATRTTCRLDVLGTRSQNLSPVFQYVFIDNALPLLLPTFNTL